MALLTTAILLLAVAALAQLDSAAIHLPLLRRGARFSRREPANLTHLAHVLRDAELNYVRSQREVEGNRLVRRWRPSEAYDENDPDLIDVAGRENRW